MSINALTAHTCSALEISDELKVGDTGMKKMAKKAQKGRKAQPASQCHPARLRTCR
jgi:hypothetical protein